MKHENEEIGGSKRSWASTREKLIGHGYLTETARILINHVTEPQAAPEATRPYAPR